MAHQMTSRTDYTEERGISRIADPMPLGFLALAFTTALLGCSYAHFLVPGPRPGLGLLTVGPGMSLFIPAALLFGGIVQFLVGMWEFRRGETVPATVFSAYGGFLASLGLLLLPGFGLASTFGTDTVALNHALGLVYLCWLLCIAVLLLASLRSAHMLLTLVLALLGLSFLFIMIGEFANANTPLLMIGGWIGIVTALMAWYASLANLLAIEHSPLKVPMGQMA